MTQSKVAICLLPMALLVQACSASSSSPAEPADAAAIAEVPIGRYALACQFAFEQGGAKIYETGVYDGTSASYELTFHFFADPGCSVPFVTFVSKGDFVARPSSNVPGAIEFDATWTGRTMRADSEASVPLLNSGCGKPPWSLGQTQDIFATGCAAAGFRPSAECVRDFDLLRVSGSTLSLGQRPADNNMCTPDRRPTALSPSVWMKAS